MNNAVPEYCGARSIAICQIRRVSGCVAMAPTAECCASRPEPDHAGPVVVDATTGGVSGTVAELLPLPPPQEPSRRNGVSAAMRAARWRETEDLCRKSALYEIRQSDGLLFALGLYSQKCDPNMNSQNALFRPAFCALTRATSDCVPLPPLSPHAKIPHGDRKSNSQDHIARSKRRRARCGVLVVAPGGRAACGS